MKWWRLSLHKTFLNHPVQRKKVQCARLSIIPDRPIILRIHVQDWFCISLSINITRKTNRKTSPVQVSNIMLRIFISPYSISRLQCCNHSEASDESKRSASLTSVFFEASLHLTCSFAEAAQPPRPQGSACAGLCELPKC